jgi:hypothetical protein
VNFSGDGVDQIDSVPSCKMEKLLLIANLLICTKFSIDLTCFARSCRVLGVEIRLIQCKEQKQSFSVIRHFACKDYLGIYQILR